MVDPAVALASPSCRIASDLIAVAFGPQRGRLNKQSDQRTARYDERFERYDQPIARCAQLSELVIIATVVSHDLPARYDSACVPADRVIVAEDRRTFVHDRLLMRSCNLFCRSDALSGAAHRPIVSYDPQITGPAPSLHACASVGRTIRLADRRIGSDVQAAGSSNQAIASPNQPSRSAERNSL
jgi:hypothetical protein